MIAVSLVMFIGWTRNSPVFSKHCGPVGLRELADRFTNTGYNAEKKFEGKCKKEKKKEAYSNKQQTLLNPTQLGLSEGRNRQNLITN